MSHTQPIIYFGTKSNSSLSPSSPSYARPSFRIPFAGENCLGSGGGGDRIGEGGGGGHLFVHGTSCDERCGVIATSPPKGRFVHD